MLIDPGALAQLLEAADDRAPITLQATAPASTWRQMLNLRAGAGPAVLSTRAAAQRFGWKARDWGRWAVEGLIPGAVKEGRGWDLPRDACDALYRKKMGLPPAEGADAQDATATNYHVKRGGNHGPRSRKLQQATAGPPPRRLAALP